MAAPKTSAKKEAPHAGKRTRQSGASKRKAKREKTTNQQKQLAAAAVAYAKGEHTKPASEEKEEMVLAEPFDVAGEEPVVEPLQAKEPSRDPSVETQAPVVSGTLEGAATTTSEAAPSTPGGHVLTTARLLKETARRAQQEKQQQSSSSNTLAANSDFISFSMDASEGESVADDAADDAVSDEEEVTIFSKVAEKLGAFVKDSKDTVANKRKRQAINEEETGTPQSKAARKKARVLMEQDPYPWLQGKDYAREQEPSRILHRELQDFVKFVEPTAGEHALRSLVISRIRGVVAAKWPTASVHAFGSFETRLYLPTSDIDLVLLSSGQPGDTVYEQPKHLKKLAHLLVKAGIARDIQVITSARVPIIKFIDKLTQIHVDISFNKPTGLVAAGVVKRYCKQMPALRPLVIFIKHFLNMRGMNEVYLGGLGSYAITCLVISFLQRHPKIASGQIISKDNLGVLAVEFLELYGKRFNYDVVGININGTGKYFSKQAVGWQRPGQTYLLSIQDPTDAENDIAKSSFGILKVKGTLAGGHDFLVQRLYDVNDRIKERRRSAQGSGAGAESILSAVVSIDQDMKDSRHHLASCFDQANVKEMLQEMTEQEEQVVTEASEVAEIKLPANTAKKDTVYVAVEDDDDDDEEDNLIDSDGYKFNKPTGYRPPSAPSDVDDLYSKLNQPAQKAPTAPKSTSKGHQGDAYLIESSDEEQVSKPAQQPAVIDLDGEDSKAKQVGKAARAKFWQDKGQVIADDDADDST